MQKRINEQKNKKEQNVEWTSIIWRNNKTKAMTDLKVWNKKIIKKLKKLA